jgi:hypothetical protein
MVGGYFADLRRNPGRIRDMRVAWCLLVAVLATGCGSAQPGAGVERYGISLEIPDRWNGEVSRGIVRLQRGEVSVVLHEYETSSAGEAAYFKHEWPIRLVAADFGRRHNQDDTALLHSVSGRLFSVFLSQNAPPAGELDELNAALAGIEVEAGDFYPGSAQPVRFPERRGWHTTSADATPRYAYGESAQSAAATIPYRDGPNELPPARTLEALPPDGIVVWVSLTRDSHFEPSRLDRNDTYRPRRPPPYRISDFERFYPWQGQIRNIPDYRLWAAWGERYLVDLRVFFGREHPTEAMLAEADAVVRGLRFPDWGPWELERS